MRYLQKHLPTVEFIICLALAGWALSKSNNPIKNLWNAGTNVVLTLFGGRNKKVGKDLWEKRLAKCAGCPVFYAPLRSCGSPLVQGKYTGCYCHMPTKARYECDCWAYESNAWINLVPNCWPPSYNSFYGK